MLISLKLEIDVCLLSFFRVCVVSYPDLLLVRAAPPGFNRCRKISIYRVL